jgi:hypothetical protein
MAISAATRRRDAYLAGRFWIEEMARQDRRLEAVPLPLDALRQAKGLGLRVKVLPDGTHAALVDRTIYLAENQSSRRARFSVAHEVAHVVLGHSVLGPGVGRDFMVEAEADACAAGWLVPHAHLVAELQSLGIKGQMSVDEWVEAEWRDGIVDRLVRTYDASHATVATALHDAGLVRGHDPWQRPGEGDMPAIVGAVLEARRRRRDALSRDRRRRRDAVLWHAAREGLVGGADVEALADVEAAEREEALARLRVLDADPSSVRYLPLVDLWHLVAELERGRARYLSR